LVRFRGVFSGILIAVLSLPGDLLAQAAQPQNPKGESGPQVAVLVATPVAPAGEAAQAAPPPKQSQSGMGGIAGGLGAAAQYDELKRPITAGGFVDSGPVVFQDITKQAGLSGWIHTMGVPEKKFIVETNGSGVGLIDYDNSGWLSIYLVNGSTFAALDGKEEPPHAALFRNNHDGTFTDIAAQAGVTNDRWGYGVSVADYDNDGWPDIYVGNYGKNRLYHNNHNGTFTDKAEQLGVARLGLGRLRWRRTARPLRVGLRALRPKQPADCRNQGRGLCELHVSRRGGQLRAAGAAGRAGPPVPSKGGWDV
jgi:hypothetical protein